jgi:anionic cell wall polymer biosynthesis LytR-Cps2A-Psr (LCP) family protein
MYVISLVLDKLQSGQALKSYSQIFDSIKGMFTTNLSSEQISDLVKMQLQDMAKWNIKSYAVTGSGSSGSTPLYVMMPDYSTVDKAVTLINKVVNGEALTDEDINGTSVEDVDDQEYESINIQ